MYHNIIKQKSHNYRPENSIHTLQKQTQNKSSYKPQKSTSSGSLRERLICRLFRGLNKFSLTIAYMVAK